MSETKNELYLQLKDIIKIDSPSNEKLHEQTYKPRPQWWIDKVTNK